MTKTEQLKQLIENNEMDKALSLAKSFKIWDRKEDKEVVILAHECNVNPDFYRQIGKDVPACIEAGVNTLKRIYLD